MRFTNSPIKKYLSDFYEISLKDSHTNLFDKSEWISTKGKLIERLKLIGHSSFFKRINGIDTDLFSSTNTLGTIRFYKANKVINIDSNYDLNYDLNYDSENSFDNHDDDNYYINKSLTSENNTSEITQDDFHNEKQDEKQDENQNKKQHEIPEEIDNPINRLLEQKISNGQKMTNSQFMCEMIDIFDLDRTYKNFDLISKLGSKLWILHEKIHE
ncbi:hypothetical protein QJ850_gp822 [Acanthamoeba polyphaga mimivirus]|uniref:Uncharacterized protein n=1 Tax=Acanthamoeba polyphaga mimivirus Kroon TaxID=3069720 RepID=A0A0G2Y7S8_9VIRU|nr:hypothetical protein QJ850_gp822 [Acanthamoeba polyphaga mimivirus]AKI79877.1 hypothetical protein [Acanthamoeba polyphaga mimivirus Kroon]